MCWKSAWARECPRRCGRWHLCRLIITAICVQRILFLSPPCNTYSHNAKPRWEDKSQNNEPLPLFSLQTLIKKQWAGADPLLNNGAEVFTTTGTKNCYKKIQSSNSLSLSKLFPLPSPEAFEVFRKENYQFASPLVLTGQFMQPFPTAGSYTMFCLYVHFDSCTTSIIINVQF